MSTLGPSNGFVSSCLNSQPGLSGLGTLLQIARLNHFRGQDFPAAFGLRFQYREDLSHVLTFSPKRKACLAAALSLPSPFTAMWSAEAWQPFTGVDAWEFLPWRLRACASCLRTGYHSNLFQMPWIDRCPWHREQLIDRCRVCRSPLLDGFRARKNLLECVCGLDHVNETAILRGERRAVAREREEFLGAYRGWVGEAHQRADLLICPEEPDPHGLDALRSLVGAPADFEPWSNAFTRPNITNVHLVRRRCRPMPSPLPDAEYGDMVRCANGLWPGTPSMAALPVSFWTPLVHVTRQVAGRVPGSALTSREREAMALEPCPTAASSNSRYELLFLPVQRAGAHVLLDIGVLHRTANRTLSHLAWQLLINDPARYRHSSGSHRLLLKALQLTLNRAYADGLKYVLGRHVPAIFDHPRIRSGPRLPWALVRRREGDAAEVLVAWTVRRPWDNAH